MTLQAVEDLAARIVSAQRGKLKERCAKVYEPQSTNVSAIGYRCERRTVYSRTRPEQAAPIGIELAGIFGEGDLHHADVRRQLSELGFEVLETERSFRDKMLDVGGRIDGKLPLTDDHRAERVPIEIKSVTGEPPATEQAMRNHDGLYRRYFDSFQLYLFLTNSPHGLFIFKDKITGTWSTVTVELDYDHAEILLRRAERIRDAVAAVREGGEEFLPERIADRSECSGCPFKDTICLPAEAPADPLLLAEDYDLLGQLEERESLEGPRKQFKKIDDILKTRFKMTAGNTFVVGDRFLVTKKVSTKSTRITFERLNAPETT